MSQQYQAKTIKVSELTLSMVTTVGDQGNSQQTVIGVTYAGSTDVPTLGVIVGNMELESIFELSEQIHDHLELSPNFAKKSFRTSCDFVSCQAVSYSENFAALNFYFNEQDPAYASRVSGGPHQRGLGWQVGARGRDSLKKVVAALYLCNRLPWTEVGTLPEDIGLRGNFVPSTVTAEELERHQAWYAQCPQTHAIHVLNTLAGKLLERHNTAAAARLARAELAAREILRAAQQEVSPPHHVTCPKCSKDFKREATETWKKICIDCWIAEQSKLQQEALELARARAAKAKTQSADAQAKLLAKLTQRANKAADKRIAAAKARATLSADKRIKKHQEYSEQRVALIEANAKERIAAAEHKAQVAIAMLSKRQRAALAVG